LKARILFATHRNLSQLVAEGRFRGDLFYRVNVMQIKVPPLRQRPEEIPSLAEYFLEKYSMEYRKKVERIHPVAMARLGSYSWPGNIRELENAIARAVIVAEGDSIVLNDLPESLRPVAEVICLEPSSATRASFEDQTREYKIQVANRAIMECNGNKTLAARKLRISRAYLHRLLRDEGEDEDQEPESPFETSSLTC